MKAINPVNKIPRTEWKGKFCVMRQTETLKNMKFSSLHDDVLSATEEAQRLNSERPDVAYMVIRVVTVVDH